jgi:RNA polymerase sigma factor (sigma-70 family)
MYLVAYRKLRDKEAAEEIVQDIFLRLWRERDTVHVENLNYYLFSAVRYEVIDCIRTKGRTFEYLDYYESFDSNQDLNTENQLALDELLRVIDECLHVLPEKTREIFRLHKLEYWPIPRIAARFGLSEKAIEYHLTKSVRVVRTHLKEVMVLLLAASAWF